MRNYSLITYEEKLRLWMRMTDIPGDCQGSVVVGRLKGSAYRIAMKIRLKRQDGSTLYQDEAVKPRIKFEAFLQHHQDYSRSWRTSGRRLVTTARMCKLFI